MDKQSTQALPLQTEHVPIDSILHDPANLRLHPTRNLAAIKASLAKFGQQKPIVIDGKGIVLAGNGTLTAAKELGWDTIAVVRSELTRTEATAYAIADNRSAELAEWDGVSLAETLRSLQSEDFDLDAVGFTGEEVDKLLEQMANMTLDNHGLADAIGELPSNEKSPIQQITFTVTDEQALTIQEAIKAAKDDGGFEGTGNENSNGNAIARIAETYIDGR